MDPQCRFLTLLLKTPFGFLSSGERLMTRSRAGGHDPARVSAVGRCAFVLFTMATVSGNYFDAAGAEPVAKGRAADGPQGADDRRSLLVIVGASGLAEYRNLFAIWTERLIEAGERGNLETTVLGDSPFASPLDPRHQTDRDRIAAWIEQQSAGRAKETWIVLLGHGTYDGRTPRFNLVGPDVTPADFSEWLKPLAGPVVFANCSSSSHPFLQPLAAPGRTLLSATKSGDELNFARFADFFTLALGDPKSDLNKDEQVSLDEAFVAAGKLTGEYYSGQDQLASEHAVLRDPLAKGELRTDELAARLVAESGPTDALLAAETVLVPSAFHQRLPLAVQSKLSEIKASLGELRGRCASLTEQAYFIELEVHLVALAELLEPFGLEGENAP